MAENALPPKFMWLLAGGHFPIFCLANIHLLCISKGFSFQYLACHKIAISFTRESACDKEISIEPKPDKRTSAGQAKEERYLPNVALNLMPSHQPQPQYVWIRGSHSELLTRISPCLVIFPEV